MNDTTKLILWIALAAVALGLIVWIYISSSRREKEARRIEAASLRARVEERLPDVQGHEDRASVAEAIAAEARAEAEEKVAVAERLETAAEEHRGTADHFRQEFEDLTRRADLADPDVRTDNEGYRLDEDGHRLDAEGRRIDADGDDPDRAEPVSEEPDAVDGPAEEQPAGAVAGLDADAEVRRRHDEEPGAAAAASVAGAFGMGAAELASDDEDDLADHENPFAEPAGRGEAADAYATPMTPPYAEPEPPAYAEPEPPAYAEEEPPAYAEEDADWVNGPTDESAEAPVPAADEPDWINGPVEVDSSDHTDADEPMPEPMGAEPAEPVEPVALDEPVWAEDEEAAEEPVSEAPGIAEPADTGRPRESSLDEVRDGGFGMGSAAPIEGGVQPLGHAVKGHRDSMRFVEPGEDGYDDLDPDVWFYDEDAARRAGFRRRGED